MKLLRQDSQAIVIRQTPWHLVVLAVFCALLAVGLAVRFYPERAELPAVFPLLPGTLLALAVAFAGRATVVTSRFDQARRSLLHKRRGLFGGFGVEVPFEAIASVQVAPLHAGASQRLALEVRMREGEGLKLGSYGLGQQTRLEAVAKQLRKFVGHSAKGRPYEPAKTQEVRARRRELAIGLAIELVVLGGFLALWFRP